MNLNIEVNYWDLKKKRFFNFNFYKTFEFKNNLD